MNDCFSIFTRSDLNRIRKETIKKRLVWLTGEFLRQHVAVNIRCITTVFSNMANHSFNCFVNFSINDWKENVESLNNSPFWEETQSFICFCQLTVNETVFLSLLANAVNSGYDRGERVPCHVNLLARTVFENICFPSFLRKVTSIFRQNWFCEEIPSLQNSDKAASFSAVVVNKNIASSVWKSTTVNHFAIKSRCLNTMKSFLTFKIINSGIFLYFKKVLTLPGKTPSSRQRFCFALYSPPGPR